MAWYDPRDWTSGGWDVVNPSTYPEHFVGGVKKIGGWFGDQFGPKGEEQRARLESQAGAAGQFADQAQAGYGSLGAEGDLYRRDLRRDLRAVDSGRGLSGMMLQQGLQQNLAAQQSMAAGARPQNQAMAARSAMINAGRLGAGLSGQQALAALQEKRQIQEALGNAIMQQRNQEMQVALQSRNNALGGYGNAYTGAAGQTTMGERLLGAAGGLAGAAMLKSDMRAKHKIADGEKDAGDFLKSLKPYSYEYKDGRDGTGPKFGIMAQDLEKTKAGRQAVVEAPDGTKMVKGAALAAALAATLPLLDKRLTKLEGKK